ncbi:hypothetical protein KFE98_19625 [bacterium SCSIO 12741]|nr:hypothetical protein KFE98_19625 [bacterium SCSIO 12741]
MGLEGHADVSYTVPLIEFSGKNMYEELKAIFLANPQYLDYFGSDNFDEFYKKFEFVISFAKEKIEGENLIEKNVIID